MSRISFVAPVFGPVQVSSKAIFKKCPAVRMSTDTLEEHFDVLQADGSPAGYSKARSLVHRDGDWHRSTHIWVLSNDGRLLVQKRSSLKDTFPGRWDVSAAGHISAGDSSKPSAIRELGEELGIELKDDTDLEFVTSEKASATGSTARHGEFIDNEIQDIYVYRPEETVRIEDIVLQEEEVEAVAYWQWKDYRDKLLNDDDQLVPRSRGYFETFFPWLEKEIAKS